MSEPKRPGRKLGVPNSEPTETRAGSLNDKLSTVEVVGGYLYLEVDTSELGVNAAVQRLQARILAATRYPDSMRGWKFTVAAYTAVRATLGDVRVLVRVERIA